MATGRSLIHNRLLAAVLAGLVATGAATQPRNASPDAGASSQEDCAADALSATLLGANDDVPYDGFALRLLGRHGAAVVHLRRQMASLQRGADASTFSKPPMWTGIDALQRGDLGAAEAQWTAELQVARRDGRRLEEAVLLNDLGVLDAARGDSVAARERFQQASRIFDALAERAQAAVQEMRSRLADQASRSKTASLIERLKQLRSGAATNAAQDHTLAPIGRAIAGLNEANLLAHIGQRAMAEDLFKQVLADNERALGNTDRGDNAKSDAMLVQRARADLARLYRAAGRSAEARAITNAAAPPRGSGRSGDAGDDDSQSKQNAGFPMWQLGLAQASVAAAPGQARPVAARDDKSGCRRETLADVAREQPLAHAEASQRWLGAEALRLEKAGDLGAAIDVQLRAALLAAIVRSPDREQVAWAELLRLARKRGEPAAAVLYGKRAVNAAQALRSQVEAMPRQARQAFLAERRRAYVALTHTLLDGARLAEAEGVLRLLKEDEGQPFVPTAARPQRGALPLAAAEAAWSAAFDALAVRGRALHGERQALQAGLTGPMAAAARSRSAQQALIVSATLDGAQRIADGLDMQVSEAEADDDWKLARAAAAKPRGRRSAEEQMRLDFSHLMANFLLDGIDDVIAGLRALPQDAALFETQLSPDQRRRAADLEQRLPRQRAVLASKLHWVLAEPAPDAQLLQRLSGQANQTLGTMNDALFGGMTRQMRANWSITRRLDAVDAEALALRQRLQPGLAASTAQKFDAAAEAQLASGQRTLAALPAGTVAVYYLQGDTRLDALVVDAGRRRAVRIDAGAAELDARIKRYVAALADGSLDLLPEARALHDTLWRPLGLDGGDERRPATVMLSLDGALRALPFAALHDGRQWLIERHALNVYTSAAPAALTARPSPRWQIAAFGASLGGSIDGKAMKPLPAVPDELAAVVAAPAGAGGAQRSGGRGEAKLDAAFTAAALRQALARRAPVLHLASHFEFAAGDLQRSALLLGDGSALRLSELAGAAWRLDHVELVTLSACETARTGDDAFGQEVEGLGTLLQAQGAAAVLATLWPVHDGSTAAFMAAMYGQRERDQLSRAEAVRQAQLQLLRGALTPDRPGFDGPARSGQRAGGRSSAWSHPQHWAPFVLMGNWL